MLLSYSTMELNSIATSYFGNHSRGLDPTLEARFPIYAY